ncbi:MAG: SDR family oxidoreductase [Pirellulales bacterium]
MAKRSIDGSRAIVTGASSGIGREIARQLAAAGAHLLVVARREERLTELAEELRGKSRTVETLAGDLTDPDVRQQLIELARSKLGGLDLLVNNAGATAVGRFEDSTPDDLRRVMEINFFAAAELIRAALPLLREGRQPAIVNVGSILGHRAIPRRSEYCASKFALQGLSESLRAEFGRLGIDVIVVSPGSTATELHDRSGRTETGENTPWPEQPAASPAEVAKATLRAIRRGKREIVPSGRGRWLLALNSVAPRVVDRVMARYG